jgi:hypothetical protein
MGKQSIRDWLKEKVGDIGWHLFLWAREYTAEEYWKHIYQQEKSYGGDSTDSAQ